jgi:hypothetical protein
MPDQRPPPHSLDQQQQGKSCLTCACDLLSRASIGGGWRRLAEVLAELAERRVRQGGYDRRRL